MKLPKSEKQKSNFIIGSIIIKENIQHLERVIGKFLKKTSHSHYCRDGRSGTDDSEFIFEEF